MNKRVLLDYKDRVAYITLNRPEKRNALNPEMVAGIMEALNRVRTENQAKVVVLQAAGAAFCAGADLEYLKSLQTNSYEENLHDSQNLMTLFKTLIQFPLPLIAKVHGAAIAGGCGLASVCDFCFASEESMLGYSEVNIGFVPAIVMVFLSRKIGEGKARELLLTGKIISASEAVTYGLINQSLPAEVLDAEVDKLAQNLCARCAPDSMRLIKEMLFAMPSGYDEALNYAAQCNAVARSTEDCKKGIAAFLNKEKIRW